MTKEYMQKHCESGYQTAQISFAEIAEILEFNAVYTPFIFKDGKRSKANLSGTTKWIVLDIDDSNITDTECHLMLDSINHHIVRTSDISNPFKFRIIVELDAAVDIPELRWKAFLTILSDEIGVKADLLPKSQIFFSYEGRDVLTTLEENTLSTKLLLARLTDTKETKSPKSLAKGQKTLLLNDPMETFGYAFNAPAGRGSSEIIRACHYAQDLGATKEDVLALANDINNFWDESMDPTRMETTILSQINRWTF